jgi:hypothetical protein
VSLWWLCWLENCGQMLGCQVAGQGGVCLAKSRIWAKGGRAVHRCCASSRDMLLSCCEHGRPGRKVRWRGEVNVTAHVTSEEVTNCGLCAVFEKCALGLSVTLVALLVRKLWVNAWLPSGWPRKSVPCKISDLGQGRRGQCIGAVHHQGTVVVECWRCEIRDVKIWAHAHWCAHQLSECGQKL